MPLFRKFTVAMSVSTHASGRKDVGQHPKKKNEMKINVEIVRKKLNTITIEMKKKRKNVQAH